MANDDSRPILACPSHDTLNPLLPFIEILIDSEVQQMFGKADDEDIWEFGLRIEVYLNCLWYKAYLKEINNMRLKTKYPSTAQHLYLDENGAQYLDGKPQFEEIKEVPENVDHLEFRVRLLEARNSVMSSRTISTAMVMSQFTDDKPGGRELVSAADFSFQEFLASLESWNLTDENDTPIPITEEAIYQLPKWMYTQMFAAVDKVNNPKN